MYCYWRIIDIDNPVIVWYLSCVIYLFSSMYYIQTLPYTVNTILQLFKQIMAAEAVISINLAQMNTIHNWK